MKIVILDGFAVNPGDLDWGFLSKYGEYEVFDKTPDTLCAEKCVGAEVVFTNRAKITAELLDACPTVRYVSALGTGYDMIDIDACRRRGVQVVNIPAYSTASVAQLTIQLLLALYSDLDGIQKIVRDGNWTGLPRFHYETINYTELDSLTLGLVGCGAIGGRVAAIAAALGMRVIAATARKHEDTETVSFRTLDEVRREADVLSIHCPLNDSTRGMIDKDFISMMKPGAKLINTARGAILNERDVADALNDGRLSGAALDVLAAEPAVPENPLLTAKNCMITPHIAWASRAARERLIRVIDESLSSYAKTGKGINVIC